MVFEMGANTWLASPGCNLRNGAAGRIKGCQARKHDCRETAKVRGSSNRGIRSATAVESGPSCQRMKRAVEERARLSNVCPCQRGPAWLKEATVSPVADTSDLKLLREPRIALHKMSRISSAAARNQYTKSRVCSTTGWATDRSECQPSSHASRTIRSAW